MPPKIKIEDYLDDGEKISIVLEGDVDERRVLQVLQMLKLMKGAEESGRRRGGSLRSFIWRVIVENFGDGTWFSLKDLYNVARKEEPGLRLTSVSTYVSRFVNEGKLVKKGKRPNTRYRVKVIVERV